MVDQSSICALADPNKYASGSINGTIYIWVGNQCQKVVKVH